MAILCLASDLADLKERLGKILVAYDLDGNPVYAKDLGANGAMTALLKDALKPNLVQTLEHTPALIHGGPFGQHCARLQLAPCHKAGAETGRLLRDRGRFRL